MTAEEAKIFALAMCVELRILKPEMSQAQAYRHYGRSRVEPLIDQKKVKVIQRTANGKHYLNVLELEEAIQKNNPLNKYLIK